MPRGGRRSAAPRTGRVAPLRLPCSAGCARGPHCCGYCDDSSSALPPAGGGLPPSPAGFTCQRDAVPLTPALAEGQEPPQGRLRRTRVSLTRNRGSPPSRVKRSAPPSALDYDDRRYSRASYSFSTLSTSRSDTAT